VPLADLRGSAHSIAIHRSAEDYDDVVACGDIPGEERAELPQGSIYSLLLSSPLSLA
jgi:hypothetical protein